MVDLNFKIHRTGAKAAHHVDCDLNNLDLGLHTFDPQQIDIELPMFAQAAPLGALVAPQIGNAEPAQGLLQMLALGRHHARQGRGHLGAHGHLASAPVNKAIQLFVDNFVPGFGGIQFKGLQHRAIVFLVTVAADHLAQMVKHPAALLHLIRVKIAGAFIGLGRKLAFSHGVGFRFVI